MPNIPQNAVEVNWWISLLVQTNGPAACGECVDKGRELEDALQRVIYPVGCCPKNGSDRGIGHEVATEH